MFLVIKAPSYLSALCAAQQRGIHYLEESLFSLPHRTQEVFAYSTGNPESVYSWFAETTWQDAHYTSGTLLFYKESA